MPTELKQRYCTFDSFCTSSPHPNLNSGHGSWRIINPSRFIVEHWSTFVHKITPYYRSIGQGDDMIYNSTLSYCDAELSFVETRLLERRYWCY